MPSVRSLSEVICYHKKRLQILLMHGGLIMRRFHCAALAAVAVLGFTSVASAADMPVKAPAPIVAPLYNWTGPYIGIAGGYGWGHSDQTDPGIPILSCISPLIGTFLNCTDDGNYTLS